MKGPVGHRGRGVQSFVSFIVTTLQEANSWTTTAFLKVVTCQQRLLEGDEVGCSIYPTPELLCSSSLTDPAGSSFYTSCPSSHHSTLEWEHKASFISPSVIVRTQDPFFSIRSTINWRRWSGCVVMGLTLVPEVRSMFCLSSSSLLIFSSSSDFMASNSNVCSLCDTHVQTFVRLHRLCGG